MAKKNPLVMSQISQTSDSTQDQQLSMESAGILLSDRSFQMKFFKELDKC